MLLKFGINIVVASTLLWVGAPYIDTLIGSSPQTLNQQLTTLAQKFDKGLLSTQEYLTHLQEEGESSSALKATSSKNTQISSKSSSAVLRKARSLVGTPYMFGGNNGYGIDCSGFTVAVYRSVGIYLPRTAAQQFKRGQVIRYRDLQPGDLLFFTTYKPGPSHVGIYAGNDQMYHASSKKGVTLASIHNSYFTPRYIGARRILQ